MKARIYFGLGKWWCQRMGVIGCGSTPKDAYNDMLVLYAEAIYSTRPKYDGPVSYSTHPKYDSPVRSG